MATESVCSAAEARSRWPLTSDSCLGSEASVARERAHRCARRWHVDRGRSDLCSERQHGRVAFFAAYRAPRQPSAPRRPMCSLQLAFHIPMIPSMSLSVQSDLGFIYLAHFYAKLVCLRRLAKCARRLARVHRAPAAVHRRRTHPAGRHRACGPDPRGTASFAPLSLRLAGPAT